jgi:hypothetical protein
MMKKQCGFPWLSSKRVYLFLTLILLSANSCKSEWDIKCRFGENGHNVFWTGEAISGFVDFVNNDHADLKLERINAELIGELRYRPEKKANSTESNSSNAVVFVTERIVVHPIGGQGKFQVPYGSHSWPFRLRLNGSLPASVDKNDSNLPVIRYFIRVKFVRPEWYNSNVERLCHIIVKHSALPTNVSKLEKQDTSKRKGVRLRVTLQKNAVNAGSNFSIDIDLDNPRQNYIDHISVTLVQNLELGSGKQEQYNLVRKNLEKIQKVKDKHFAGNFQLTVPHTASASFSFQLPSTSYTTQSLAIRYSLQFGLHLRGFFTNIYLQFPVIVTNTMPKRGAKIWSP